ncbi:MATE efflux family protein [Stipitochalara longipes BDJ]|nr:MATE efflux family protein [Stipitochalara longipes BDJ]
MSSTYADENGWLFGNRRPPTYHPLSQSDTIYGTIEPEIPGGPLIANHHAHYRELHGYDDTTSPSSKHPTENTPLRNPPIDFDEKSIPTATLFKDEIKTIVLSTAPMMLSMLLQTSISVSSIFVVGRIGQRELGAVSLANLTAIITGYGIYQGFSISLDTLCPQAYGAGQYQLVGLHMQRMVAFLLLLTIPIGAFWLNAARVIAFLIPDEHGETAQLAGTYLRIVLLGAPGFACFEAGKKFVQSQGLFRATLAVLLICAPLNGFMSWIFKLGWGFNGAPISVAITNNLLPLLLALYVRFISGLECWHPLSRKIFQNWKPMVRLAIPTFLMLEACFLSWELETIVSSYIGPIELAAQSALASIVSLVYQICTSASVASSTRISNTVGAGLPRRALVATHVSMGIGVFLGTMNLVLLISLREKIPRLFTADIEVLAEIMAMIPVYASMGILDGIISACNGIICAVGRPKLSSYSAALSSWLISVPLSLLLAFVAGWKLLGIWIGCLVGFAVCAIVELWFVWKLDWDRAFNEARARNKQQDM